jgi:hypothetical protein
LGQRVRGHRHRIRADRRGDFPLAIIVMVNTLGTTLNTKFTSINTKIK